MHPNEKLIRDLADIWNRGDVEDAKARYSDDIVVTIPGRNLLSGTYHGKEDWLNNFVSKMVGLTEGNIEIVEIVDAFANDGGTITMDRVRLSRKGRTIEVVRLFLYTIRDGKVCAIRQYEEDQYLIDDFFS